MPENFLSDNGSKFLPKAIRSCLKQIGMEPLYFEPVSPCENVYSESSHSRVRDEFINCEVFENLLSTRRQREAWKERYN